jgi:reverse gyrase
MMQRCLHCWSRAEIELRRMDTTVADSDEPEACTFGVQPHRSNEDFSAIDSGERVDVTVTAEREPETSPATPHLTDPLVRDSGEKADVAENEDHSVLDSGEQLNDTCTQEQLNVACTKEINEDSSALDSGERVDVTVTEEREPETSPATPHPTDPLVRDSGEKANVAENEDLSVLDSVAQLNDTCPFSAIPFPLLEL